MKLKAVCKLWAAALMISSTVMALGTERDNEIERRATAVDAQAAEAKLASLVLHGMGRLNKVSNGHETQLTPKAYLATRFQSNVHAVQAYREALRDCLTPQKAAHAPGAEVAQSFARFLDQYSTFLSDSVLQSRRVDVRTLEDYSILIRIYLHGLERGDRREAQQMDQALQSAVVEIAHTLESATAPTASMEEYVANKRVENKAIPHPWTHGIKAIDLVSSAVKPAKVCPTPEAIPYYTVR